MSCDGEKDGAMRSILWFLFGSRTMASSRMHGYMIHESFVVKGRQSAIAYSPSSRLKADLPEIGIGILPVTLEGTVSVVQKLRGTHTDRLIDWLRAKGSKVVYINCDLEPENQSWRKADRILVPSEKLREYHLNNGAGDVRVVKEPYEYAIAPDQKMPASGKLTVAWFGNKLHWQGLQAWKSLLEKWFSRHLDFITCSDHPDATYPWSYETQRRILSEAAFVIIPSEYGAEFAVKSPNRLVQSFAVSAPVIAGPLPSYSSVLAEANEVTGQRCGFIASTEDEFCASVEQMLNPGFRKLAAEACFRYVEPRYSSHAVADDWAVNLFDGNDRRVGPRRHALRLAHVRCKIRTGAAKRRALSALRRQVSRLFDEA